MSPKLTPVTDADPDQSGGRRPDPIDRAVGIQLRRLRARKGMSQPELARSVGLTYQQVQKYEKGINRVSISMLCRLAGSLDADPAQIVSAATALAPSTTTISPDVEMFATKVSGLSPRIRRELLALVDAMLRSSVGVR